MRNTIHDASNFNMLEEDWGEMKLNETGRRGLERKNSLQQAKYLKLQSFSGLNRISDRFEFSAC